MIKNNKYFYPPPKEEFDFKELFKLIASAGAGRQVDEDGFSTGPWTPELLTDAISRIDANRDGIELRTVQLWFQDNDKGVSTDNIRWLARILGCDDPSATRDWQMELIAAQSRLATKRRRRKTSVGAGVAVNSYTETDQISVQEPSTQPKTSEKHNLERPVSGISLARRSEAVFTRRSPLDLPVLVFAGAVALGFLAYIFRIHSFVYSPDGGPIRQIGFIWAPNWTILFLVLLPLYLAFTSDLLVHWKNEGRHHLSKSLAPMREGDWGWSSTVEASSYSYWASLFLCLPFAAIFQWVNSRLIPLVTGDPGNFAMDWGRIAIVHPEVISVPEALVFTALAYLYMGLSFFLFFVGQILLYTLAFDYWRMTKAFRPESHSYYLGELRSLGRRISDGILRCTILGLFIAIVMKLQSAFLISGEVTILDWLVGDILSALGAKDEVRIWLDRITPTHYSSLLIVLVSCAVFLYGTIRISSTMRKLELRNSTAVVIDMQQSADFNIEVRVPWMRMTLVVALLVINYLLIGVFDGFSILLLAGILAGFYSLVDPSLGERRQSTVGANQNV